VNVDDYANICLLSNSRDAAPVDGKGDRRYCVVSVATHRKGDLDYFDKLHVARPRVHWEKKTHRRSPLHVRFVLTWALDEGAGWSWWWWWWW
jgi:hypothetical protein